MRFLYEIQGIEGPDIVQFVQLDAHRHNQQDFTYATLEDIQEEIVLSN